MYNHRGGGHGILFPPPFHHFVLSFLPKLGIVFFCPPPLCRWTTPERKMNRGAIRVRPRAKATKQLEGAPSQETQTCVNAATTINLAQRGRAHASE